MGRWKKFYRGKAYYLGSGRGKSDVASYREAVVAWGVLKVKLDAEIVRLPRVRDAEYDEVIREWELVLSWSVQHGADEEAVVAREMLGALRERREKPRQPLVTHSDRLWSRFRPDPKVLEEIADLAMNDLAMNSGSIDMEQFRVEMLKRRGMFPISGLLLKPSSLGEVDSWQRAEIQWKDRLANQSHSVAAEETHSLGGWVKMFLAKEQQRVGAGELSAGRFTSPNWTAPVLWFGVGKGCSSWSKTSEIKHTRILVDLKISVVPYGNTGAFANWRYRVQFCATNFPMGRDRSWPS